MQFGSIYCHYPPHKAVNLFMYSWTPFLSIFDSRSSIFMSYNVIVIVHVVKYCFSEDKPMPVSNYLESGSELKIKVDLAYPLNATEEDVKTEESTEDEMVRRYSKLTSTRWTITSVDYFSDYFIFLTKVCVCLRYGRKRKWSNFQLSVESNPGLHWFCFTTLCDWSRNLAPLFQPIRCITKTNRDLVTRVFPRLRPFTCICFEFSLAPWNIYCTFVLIGRRRCDNLGYDKPIESRVSKRGKMRVS